MTPALRIAPRSAVVLTLASLAGLAAFFWPMFVPAQPEAIARTGEAPFIFIVVLPVLVAITVAELSSGRIDTKALAMLGVLSAVNAALRPLGAGTAGIETVFFLLVLAGRVFGPGFGFLLGSTSLFASALLTAGVGPWLPFQMLAASWVGLGAGLLPPRIRGRGEIAILAAYTALGAYAYGFCMNMWFWPFSPAADTQLSYVPGADLLDNLHRFALSSPPPPPPSAGTPAAPSPTPSPSRFSAQRSSPPCAAPPAAPPSTHQPHSSRPSRNRPRPEAILRS